MKHRCCGGHRKAAAAQVDTHLARKSRSEILRRSAHKNVSCLPDKTARSSIIQCTVGRAQTDHRVLVGTPASRMEPTITAQEQPSNRSITRMNQPSKKVERGLTAYPTIPKSAPIHCHGEKSKICFQRIMGLLLIDRPLGLDRHLVHIEKGSKPPNKCGDRADYVPFLVISARFTSHFRYQFLIAKRGNWPCQMKFQGFEVEA
jgi:hypothetical protein